VGLGGVWVIFFLALTLALLLGGGYARIERLPSSR